jgi:hypothetical protein
VDEVEIVGRVRVEEVGLELTEDGIPLAERGIPFCPSSAYLAGL